MVEVFFYVFMFGLYSGGDKNGCQSLGNHMPMIGMGDAWISSTEWREKNGKRGGAFHFCQWVRIWFIFYSYIKMLVFNILGLVINY